MHKRRTTPTIVIGSSLIGAFLCFANPAKAQMFDYKATIKIPPEFGSNPAMESSKILNGMQLAGMSHQNAEEDKKSSVAWMKELDKGGSATGRISIICGTWGSYALFFEPQMFDHPGKPFYQEELYNNQLTCICDYPAANPQFQRYDREVFAGVELEKYALAGYLDKRAKLVSSRQIGDGKVERVYTFQPLDPNFFLEKFEVVIANGKLLSGKSWYVPKDSKEFLFSVVKCSGFKMMDGHLWPTTITADHYAKNLVVQSDKFTIEDIKPSGPVTLSAILPSHISIMDSRLGIGNDVSYPWTGKVIPLSDLKRRRDRLGTLFSSAAGVSPEIIIGGVVLIIGGIGLKSFSKRKKPIIKIDNSGP